MNISSKFQKRVEKFLQRISRTNHSSYTRDPRALNRANLKMVNLEKKDIFKEKKTFSKNNESEGTFEFQIQYQISRTKSKNGQSNLLLNDSGHSLVEKSPDGQCRQMFGDRNIFPTMQVSKAISDLSVRKKVESFSTKIFTSDHYGIVIELQNSGYKKLNSARRTTEINLRRGTKTNCFNNSAEVDRNLQLRLVGKRRRLISILRRFNNASSPQRRNCISQIFLARSQILVISLIPTITVISKLTEANNTLRSKLLYIQTLTEDTH